MHTSVFQSGILICYLLKHGPRSNCSALFLTVPHRLLSRVGQTRSKIGAQFCGKNFILTDPVSGFGVVFFRVARRPEVGLGRIHWELGSDLEHAGSGCLRFSLLWKSDDQQSTPIRWSSWPSTRTPQGRGAAILQWRS